MAVVILFVFYVRNFLESCFQVMWQHRSPGRPVVLPLWSPHIQLMRNALAVEHHGKLSGSFGILIIAATGKNMDMFALADIFQVPVV